MDYDLQDPGGSALRSSGAMPQACLDHVGQVICGIEKKLTLSTTVPDSKFRLNFESQGGMWMRRGDTYGSRNVCMLHRNV